MRGDKSLGNLHPELTIEPIYKSDHSSSGAENEFDTSSGGQRVSTFIDSEGRLQIKTVSESPEIKNLSERGESEGDTDHGDQNEDGELSHCVGL